MTFVELDFFEHFDERRNFQFFEDACFVGTDRAFGKVEFDGDFFRPIAFDQHVHHLQFTLREVFERVLAIGFIFEGIA